MTYWQRWVSQPQKVWLRRAIFQVHLWSGIGVGLYLVVVSVTGSVLVFSNELYRAATRAPILVSASGPPLSRDELEAAAGRAFPGYTISRITRPRNPAQAINVTVRRGDDSKDRLVNPYTGEDLGNAVPRGIWLVSRLIQLHDDLLGGETGRRVNGAGALMLIALTFTGVVVWWPGIKTWRRSLTLRRHVGWQRFTWDLHSMVGFWSLGILVLFGLSGAYLGFPEPVQDFADRLQPVTELNAGTRAVDSILYWLAYLHFGRINGIGIPCHGRGLCDWTVKSLWAVMGLVPAAMFVTGALIWWKRVVRPSPRRRRAS